MKSIKTVGVPVLAGLLTMSGLAFAAEAGKAGDTQKAKSYTLNTCIVTGEKLGGDMGKPYVFAYQGQEFKLCCKSCLKDFNKEPAKYVKRLAEAQKSGKAKLAPVPEQGHSEHHGHQH